MTIQYDNTFEDKLLNPLNYRGAQLKKNIVSSWAASFRDYILPALPIEEIDGLYSGNIGRRTKNHRRLAGAMILQETFNLTDEQTIQHFMHDALWNYALHLDSEDDKDCYLVLRTYWDFRNRVQEAGLADPIFLILTKKIAKKFNVLLKKQRLDSTHLNSNMKKLGRISLFIHTIRLFLTNLKRQHLDLFNSIDTDDDPITTKYMGFRKNEYNYFAQFKSSERQLLLEEVKDHLFLLVKKFENDPVISAEKPYRLLVRLMSEQCKIVPAGNSSEPELDDILILKDPKEIPSDSLQNPSDPDASYDGHKGQGYQVQLQETYSDPSEAGEGNLPPVLNLITHANVQGAHEHDAHALEPAILDTERNKLAPEVILADTAYGSDDNSEFAKEHGIELISPVSGKNNLETDEFKLSEFKYNEKYEIIECPRGCQPVNIRELGDGNLKTGFKASDCNECPMKAKCLVNFKEDVSVATFKYKKSKARLSVRRVVEQSEKFKKEYRARSGIEGTNSVVKRKNGLGRLRVRGKKAVTCKVIFKVIAENVRRVASFIREKAKYELQFEAI
jgi:hypothetical protein